jgi:hypothetical protein
LFFEVGWHSSFALQHIVQFSQTSGSSKTDGTPQSEMKEEVSLSPHEFTYGIEPVNRLL